MESIPNDGPVSTDTPMMEALNLEIQEVRYSLPQIMRELQLERTLSYFAKEIIDQVEIAKMFADARKTRAKGKKS